jgi:hypothetical protein
MSEMTLKLSPVVPSSEYSEKFLQMMLNRMGASYFKYGAVADGFPDKINALRCVELRLKTYTETGNTEFLIDAANFLMIEFMRPRHPKAHFKPTDSQESPGRVWDGDIDPSQRPNIDIKVHE